MTARSGRSSWQTQHPLPRAAAALTWALRASSQVRDLIGSDQLSLVLAVADHMTGQMRAHSGSSTSCLVGSTVDLRLYSAGAVIPTVKLSHCDGSDEEVVS